MSRIWWFNYCPLIWMCQSERLNNKSNILHRRYLTLIYNDKLYAFEQLDKDSSVSIHIRNLKTLGIEMYKIVNGSSPALIISETFYEGRYSLRH